MPAIPTDQITGLILAGGRASRMGGVDKGLQNHLGLPLAMQALLRLQPQVGALMLNANRNLSAYASLGVPVWPDAPAGRGEPYPGPLAGFLAGLAHCETPYLVTVPCDVPNFPTDLVDRLAAALVAEGAEVAVAATLEDGRVQVQPVFCLMAANVLESLVAFTQGGQHKVDHWTGQQRCATVLFADVDAFFNANSLEDLQRLQPR